MSAGSRKRRARPRYEDLPRGRARDCKRTGKRSWHSQGDALSAAASLAHASGTSRSVRAYLCPFCGLWHLTTKPERPR